MRFVVNQTKVLDFDRAGNVVDGVEPSAFIYPQSGLLVIHQRF